LLAMPAAKGLFSRAIIQSGPGLRVNTRDDSAVLTQAMLTELAVSPSRIDDLQTIPASRLLAAMRKVQPRPVPGRGGFGPVLDENILPAHPFDPQASAISAHVPILVGCNSHEQAFFSLRDEPAFNLSDVELQQRVVAMVGGDKAGRVIDTYKQSYPGQSPSELFFLIGTDRLMRINSIRLAERKFEQRKASVYMYLFSWHSPALGGRLRAPHTVEIPFVFDNTDTPLVMTKGGPEVKHLAALMSEAWIQFAGTGNPNHKGLPNWKTYDTAQRATMIFDTNCIAVNDPGSAARQVWSSL
jgi:para-nitrobenzyl esterase